MSVHASDKATEQDPGTQRREMEYLLMAGSRELQAKLAPCSLRVHFENDPFPMKAF